MSSAEAKQLPQNHISQPTSSRGQDKSVLKLAPGIILSAVAAIAAIIAGKLLPGLSVLLIAIVLGVILCNVLTLPAIFSPGIAFTQKTLLRAGVVLLGYQLLISDVLGLGAGMIVTVIAIVGLGIAGTLFLGKLLSVEPTQRLLIACGFSICGAAAVAAVDGVVQVKDRKQVMTAVALVVIFGTTMIPLIPALTQWLGLSEAQGGMWAGGSIHEVAQAVAAGGAMGATALSLAAVVKLARVLMLAPRHGDNQRQGTKQTQDSGREKHRKAASFSTALCARLYSSDAPKKFRDHARTTERTSQGGTELSTRGGDVRPRNRRSHQISPSHRIQTFSSGSMLNGIGCVTCFRGNPAHHPLTRARQKG